MMRYTKPRTLHFLHDAAHNAKQHAQHFVSYGGRWCRAVVLN